MVEPWQPKPLALSLAANAPSSMTGSQLVVEGGVMVGPPG
jgi:hypothetical protein